MKYIILAGLLPVGLLHPALFLLWWAVLAGMAQKEKAASMQQHQSGQAETV